MYIDGDGSIYSQGEEDFQVSARLLLRGVPRTIVRNLFIVPILVRSNQITINDVANGSAAVISDQAIILSSFSLIISFIHLRFYLYF